jgi:hypothetical protein
MKLNFVLLFLCMGFVPAVAVPADSLDAAAESIPTSHLVQAVDLAKTLQSNGTKPLVLQVGSRILFTQAHISGSEYVGAAGQDGGLQALELRVRELDHAQPIVIYCGCCPWPKCPNIHRAYDKLAGMGFTHVQVLYIAENFGTDWVDKGFPVDKNVQ